MSKKLQWQVEKLIVLQADVDDESPQVLGALVQKALSEGALDAHLTALVMKKNRPGTRIEVLCKPEDRDPLIRLLMVETTTLGVKSMEVERHALERQLVRLVLHGIKIRVKLALLDGKVIRAQPEFEDCRSAAGELGRPVRDVLDEAKAAARAAFLKD